MTVRSCMTCDPVTAGPETRLREALQLMRAHGLRHLPVVDHERSYLGIIRERPLQTAIEENPDNPDDRGILGLTEIGAPTLRGDESYEDAYIQLAQHPDFNPLSVVASGRLVGTVSQTELLRALAGLPKLRVEDAGTASIQDEPVGAPRRPAAVDEPRPRDMPEGGAQRSG